MHKLYNLLIIAQHDTYIMSTVYDLCHLNYTNNHWYYRDFTHSLRKTFYYLKKKVKAGHKMKSFPAVLQQRIQLWCTAMQCSSWTACTLRGQGYEYLIIYSNVMEHWIHLHLYASQFDFNSTSPNTQYSKKLLCVTDGVCQTFCPLSQMKHVCDLASWVVYLNNSNLNM